MAFYSVKMGLSGELSQQEAMDLLRNAGADVIQTSDGLCVKTESSAREIQSSSERLSKLQFEELSDKVCAQDLSQDVRSFMGLSAE